MPKFEDFLMETEQLAENLDNPNFRILDVTGMLTSKFENLAEAEVFANSHIPGAQFFDVASAKGLLSDPNADLPWSWPSKEQVENVMGDFGISNDCQVIIYAGTPRQGIDNGPMWCTRTWWILHHHGVNCAILNGGLEKWSAEGRPVTAEIPKPRKAVFEAVRSGKIVADKSEVSKAINQGQTAIIDALSAESYGGTAKVKYGGRKGQITGAVNIPQTSVVDPNTGLFADLDVLRKLFENAGIFQDKPVITYCGGGIAATVDAFALLRLGYEDVAIYDASLMEWANDPNLPMTDPSED